MCLQHSHAVDATHQCNDNHLRLTRMSTTYRGLYRRLWGAEFPPFTEACNAIGGMGLLVATRRLRLRFGAGCLLHSKQIVA
jgi:hypothetical protein